MLELLLLFLITAPARLVQSIEHTDRAALLITDYLLPAKATLRTILRLVSRAPSPGHRAAAAADAGFDAVEFLFPYDFAADDVGERLHRSEGVGRKGRRILGVHFGGIVHLVGVALVAGAQAHIETVIQAGVALLAAV